MCAGGFRGPKSSNRIELSRFVQELLLFFRFGFPQLWGVGQVGGGCLGWSAIVYMSSGMFWGKESSNRIELSWLVQELLKFGVLGSLWLWGGGRWVGVSWDIWGHGGCPHTHTHACACMHMHTHTCIELQMAASMEASMFSMFSMFNMHVHACVCMRAWDTPPHTHTYPHPIHPSATPQGGGPPESLKIW